MLKKSGWTNFSMAEKRHDYERIRDICDSRGVEFSVCEDGHFYEFRDLWSNPNDCCNAVGKGKGFAYTIRDA